MKLAGLTLWRNNYGSILQAYALQKSLNDFENVDYEIICQYGKQITSLDNLKDKIKRHGILETLNRIVWKFGLKKLRERNRKVQKFVNDKLIVSERQYDNEHIIEANEVYDGFVCGSDQVWNPALFPVDSIYWLSFADKNKYKIAYAPSVGVDNVTEDQAKSIKENLATFNAVSCREESGSVLINKILGENRCVTVLDPTLMVEKSIWDNLCPPRKYQEPYIFSYMLRGNKKQRKVIEAFAKEKNLKIVTMPFLDTEKIEKYDFKFGDIKFWDASPDEFISVIRYADYVFTDSFHCMIFSCLYHREFFTFPKIGKAQLNRITDLQKLFGIPNRMINDNSTFKEINSVNKIDWEKVDKIINEKRKVSQHYLYDNITNIINS